MQAGRKKARGKNDENRPEKGSAACGGKNVRNGVEILDDFHPRGIPAGLSGGGRHGMKKE